MNITKYDISLKEISELKNEIKSHSSLKFDLPKSL